MKNLRNASNSKMKSCNLKAVVDKVKVTSVTVNWQCQVGGAIKEFRSFETTFLYKIQLTNVQKNYLLDGSQNTVLPKKGALKPSYFK